MDSGGLDCDGIDVAVLSPGWEHIVLSAASLGFD